MSYKPIDGGSGDVAGPASSVDNRIVRLLRKKWELGPLIHKENK